jgi:pyruvate formate lyase activating enzyme
MEIEEILDEVIRDMDFYRNSGGGITLSGGEVLLQSEFAGRLLAASKDRGLHTVLDTSGFASWDSLEKVLRFVDMILWDIKHLDSEAHRRMTGVGNELILDNLIRAANLGKLIWLRMPVIAGFNDDEDHIRAIVALAKTISAEKISLLPYHEGGKSKCEQLGRIYPLPEAKAPSDEDVNRLKTLIESQGIKATIGS